MRQLGALAVDGEPKHKMKRYHQMGPLIADVKPQSIIEIGVHSATRACYMSEEALKHQETVKYLGFDIFEGGDAAFHIAAMNGKGIPSEKMARQRLSAFTSQKKIHDHRFSWKLIVGDTRQTLAGRQYKADLVFIDGDHRVKTIRSDYEAVRASRCIVFDDYLMPGPGGKLPDLDVYGANRIVDEIPSATILPIMDLSKDGWYAAFAVVRNDN
jgi:Methyltransferase domain